VEERKREYAAELEGQIAEKQRVKRAEKEANRRQANNAVGMGNVMRDMRDGVRDGLADGAYAMYVTRHPNRPRLTLNPKP
jgi:hypothetical protein